MYPVKEKEERRINHITPSVVFPVRRKRIINGRRRKEEEKL